MNILTSKIENLEISEEKMEKENKEEIEDMEKIGFY